MSKHMRRGGFGRKRGAAGGCGTCVAFNDGRDAVAAECCAPGSREHWVRWSAAPFHKPRAEHLGRVWREGGGAFLSSLAETAHVCACAEHDVLYAQLDQLSHPKAGLDGGDQQGVVAPTEQGAAVG